MAIKKSITEAAKVLGEAINGDYRARGALKQLVTEGHVSGLSEALTSADLNSAFTSSISQKLVSQYADAERVWTKIAKRNTLEDFKPSYFREFDWDKGLQVDEANGVAVTPGSLARVPELAQYPTFKFSTSENQIQTYKHGARIPFSWEMVINDEWGFIQSIPGNMLRLALNTEESEAFRTFVSATGPITAVFGTVDTDKLTLASLKAAKTQVRSRKVNGRSVRVPRFALVVPPALEDTARDLLAIRELEVTDANGTYKTTTANSDIELVVADILTDIDVSANVDTTWYLLPAGGTDGTRDSILVNFLRNHESPEFRVSGATGLYLGGGAVPGTEGSLLNDDIEYRVRHVVAGGTHYTDALYASNGTV